MERCGNVKTIFPGLKKVGKIKLKFRRRREFCPLWLENMDSCLEICGNGFNQQFSLKNLYKS